MKLSRLVMLATVLAGNLWFSTITRAQKSAPAPCAPAVTNSGGDPTTLAAADNDFGFRLFAQLLSRAHNSANLFMSPLSAATALQMTYDGARSGTQQAMARALRLQGRSQQAVRRDAAALLHTLQNSDPKAGSEIANSVWSRAGVAFNPAFLQHAQRSYGARVTTLDFKSPKAPTVINDWVSCATHGKITSIVGHKIPVRTVMYLINAVYFHGVWTFAFDPKLTKQHPFTTGDGTIQRVPVMSVVGSFPYYEGPDFQMASLPYGTGRFDMVIVLPREGLPLNRFARTITASMWRNWTSQLRPVTLSVSLPRFKLENDFILNRSLAALGMGVAFGRTADFSGLCALCYISFVRQKSYLNVDEEGTTAAAVTVVSVNDWTGVVTPAMVMDRPFLLAIRDTLTGAVLFLGAVNNPS